MSDTAPQFIRANLLSPIMICGVKASGGAWYRLKDGNRYSLSKSELENLGRIMERTGFSLRHEALRGLRE